MMGHDLFLVLRLSPLAAPSRLPDSDWWSVLVPVNQQEWDLSGNKNIRMIPKMWMQLMYAWNIVKDLNAKSWARRDELARLFRLVNYRNLGVFIVMGVPPKMDGFVRENLIEMGDD